MAGTCPLTVRHVGDAPAEQLRKVGFIVHEEAGSDLIARSLGYVSDGAAGIVTPTPKRLGKLQAALRWLSGRPKLLGENFRGA
jgi:hypothetical protein